MSDSNISQKPLETIYGISQNTQANHSKNVQDNIGHDSSNKVVTEKKDVSKGNFLTSAYKKGVEVKDSLLKAAKPLKSHLTKLMGSKKDQPKEFSFHVSSTYKSSIQTQTDADVLDLEKDKQKEIQTSKSLPQTPIMQFKKQLPFKPNELRQKAIQELNPTEDAYKNRVAELQKKDNNPILKLDKNASKSEQHTAFRYNRLNNTRQLTDVEHIVVTDFNKKANQLLDELFKSDSNYLMAKKDKELYVKISTILEDKRDADLKALKDRKNLSPEAVEQAKKEITIDFEKCIVYLLDPPIQHVRSTSNFKNIDPENTFETVSSKSKQASSEQAVYLKLVTVLESRKNTDLEALKDTTHLSADALANAMKHIEADFEKSVKYLQNPPVKQVRSMFDTKPIDPITAFEEIQSESKQSTYVKAAKALQSENS